MLDELRDLFLTALKFDGNNAMPLVTKWNEAVKRVQAVFDNMTDKDPNAVPVCHCKDCKLHDNCYTEDVFKFARLNNDRRFCGVGERKGGNE